jgi:hypothetical protein
MNLNPVNLAVKAWSKAHDSTSQAASNSRVMREILRWVISLAMIMIGITLWQTFEFIKIGKVDVVVGTLLGGIFTFFGTILAVSIPAMVTALKVTEARAVTAPAMPPPTILPPANGDTA